MDWFLQQYGLDCLDQVSYLQSGLCLAQTYSGPRVPVRSGLLRRSRLTLDLEILVCTRLYVMYKGQTLRPYIKGTDFGSEASLSTSSLNCDLYFAPELRSDGIAKDLAVKLDLVFVITLRGTPFWIHTPTLCVRTTRKAD